MGILLVTFVDQSCQPPGAALAPDPIGTDRIVTEITREFDLFIPIGEIGFDINQNVNTRSQSLIGASHLEPGPSSLNKGSDLCPRKDG